MSTAPDAASAPPSAPLVLTPQLMVIYKSIYLVLDSHIALSDEAQARKNLQSRGRATTDATASGHASTAVTQRGPEAYYWHQF